LIGRGNGAALQAGDELPKPGGVDAIQSAARLRISDN
jgi:hypothetical protein